MGRNDPGNYSSLFNLLIQGQIEGTMAVLVRMVVYMENAMSYFVVIQEGRMENAMP